MDEESTPRGGTEGGSKPLSKGPAFFVILHPSHGDGSKEEGILVANRDVSSVAPVVTTGPNNSKSDFFLSANCISGEITVTLDNNNMWNEFYRCNTEMVLTKQGRRMFPYCRYWISGLNPYLKYILVMDITPLDNYRHKWNGKWWEPGGKADPHVLGRVFIHPESPSTGQYWMHQPVSFYKLKLTNNILDQDGHIILHSMHRYLPRLHVVPAEKASEVIQLNGPDVHTFTFPQTEFIAVTAYQNFQITQLKIDCNPFAKGFREGTVTGRPGKDVKHKPDLELDSSSSKNVEENEDPNNMEKLQELFRMSEYLDCDKENERFSSVQDFLRFTKSKSELAKNCKPNEDVTKRSDEPSSSVTSPSVPTEQPSVVVKQEPEDNYDYSQAVGSVAVKQEPSDGEVTDEYSNSDVDYPILEKQFAKFKEDPYLDGNHSLNSPVGLLEEKFLKPDPDSMPVLHPEPGAVDQKTLEAPELLKPDLSEEALQEPAVPKESPIFPSLTIKSEVEDDVPVKEKRRRVCKKKIDEIYATLQTALKTSRGPKRKFPVLFTKPSLTPTPGNEGTGAPIAKKRGRPPKPKIAKVGRPAKKDNPIEAPRLFPDFNPDLEDVDGVLFVAFSSKEALDVHTVKKPMDPVSSNVPSLEASTELTDDMKKILELERQLLCHLKTMKYRQVIHPALQQVGLKLNIVDPAMSIDLRYLGVELPLPYINSDTKYDESAQGLPFVSRTGKTTDFTKIKGWRDKFSTEAATSLVKIEAGRPESSLKNLSAFCSDELDEYLENEAKLMGDLKELTPEPESSISYQLPTKSSSYVRTLDSVLKKQAQQQAMSSLNASAEQLPTPRVKRKYTRRAPTLKSNPKLKPILPVPPNAKKPCKSQSPGKKYRSASYLQNMVKASPSSSVELLSKSKPTVKPSVGKQMDTIQQNLYQAQMQSQQIFSKPIGFSKSQLKLSDLEESALLEGKPRTYVTVERASVSLCTLLTAQASLKKKPSLTFNKKQGTSCKKEFCRLGCVCSSLSLAKLTKTHCRHEACMFSCECLRTKSYAGTDGLTAEESRTLQEKAEIDLSPIPGHGYQAERGVESLEVMEREHQELSVDASRNRPMKAKKRKSNEGIDKKSDIRAPIRLPLWNRSDVADDPEPLCVPEQGEIVEARISHQRYLKNKSPEGGKPGRPSTVLKVHPEDPVYSYFNNMMTCARVRGYQRKAPEEKKAKDRGICDLDASNKGHVHKTIKSIKQEKEDDGVDEIAEKKSKAVVDDGPAKLIEMISDSRRVEDHKVLNIPLQHTTTKEPQPFTFGSSDIELSQEPKSEEESTFSSVKIAMSAENQSNLDLPKLSPAEHKVESVKPPDEEPEDTSDKQEKSPRRKGLPFYSKVIPAGKLMARLKTSDLNKAELVEVNGKKYPHAKLLLGHMGAIHPANRLAAYLTHRLSPRHFHLSKLNKASAKMATISPSSDTTTEGKAKNILKPQQNKTAAQSRPSSTLTQVVTGEVGSVQKSPGVSSSEPTILGSPKPSTQSTRLLVISSPVGAEKQPPAITTTTSMNLPSLSTTSLSSAGLNTVSPSKKKPSSSLSTIMRITKVVTKSSSVYIPAGIVAENDVPSTKSNILTPPLLNLALAKSLETAANTSATPPSKNPAIRKIAPSSLLLASTTPPLGPISSQVGINIASPMTVKPVTASLVSSGASASLQKRIGSRLLLIPVNSTSTPAQPLQCVQSPPGQKMVLQPIKSPNGVNLFKHPNGQIIQLVPLQKVNSANIQQSRQQVVIRNPGPVMNVRLPLLTKPEAGANASISATSVSAASTPTNVPVISPSKTSPNKSGVTILPQNLPVLSQFGSIAVNTPPSTSNCEPSLPFPQVLTYMGSGHTVITSNVIQSLGASLANIPPPPLLQNCSPVSAAAKPTITLMSNEPGHVSDPNEQDKTLSNSLLSPQPSGEKSDQESVKDTEGQPTSEIINDENEAEEQRPPKEEIKSVSQAEDKPFHSGQQVNDQSHTSTDSTDEFLTSDEDLCPESKKKDTQGPADEDNHHESPAEKNASSQVEIVNKNPGTSISANVPEEVEEDIQSKSAEKAELSMEQSSAKLSTSSSDQKNGSPLGRDPHIKPTRPNLESEDESDIERSVDIETVEELSEEMNSPLLKASAFPVTFKKKKHGMKRKFSKKHKKKSKSEVGEYVDIESVEEIAEKINLADLKASAATLTSDKYGTEGSLPKVLKKIFKVDGEDVFSSVEDDGCNIYHRKNHTANERKRRSELRDLFGELRNAIGLYHLPKVSKSYILKQAIEEIKDLTNTADTLIKKKTLLSQTQILLVKKVSNLSGKLKEVVLKKVEYKCARDKAIEAEMKKKNLEEDDALHKASIHLPLPKMEPLIPLKLEEESYETLSSKTKKPIILGRKSFLLSKEGKQTPGVSIPTSPILMAPTGQGERNLVSGEFAGIPPTLIKADISPTQMTSGMASVGIQLPSTIQQKEIVDQSPVPVSLSALPGDLSTLTPTFSESEMDDLSMMPKIVNVTSLAPGANSDLGMDLDICTPDNERVCKSHAHSLRAEKGNVSVQDASFVTAESCMPSTSIHTDKVEGNYTDATGKSCNLYSSLHENPPQESDSRNTGASLQCKIVSSSNDTLSNQIRDSGLDLELKKLTSAIDEAGLDLSELSDTMGDPEEVDETLTLLLNEIAFLNQQISDDPDELDSVPDFPGLDTASRSSTSKLTDGDLSPLSLSGCKEATEAKEKNTPFSPFLMQLEEGEIPDSTKRNQEVGIVAREVGARREPPLPHIGAQSGPSTRETTEKPVTSDVFWRPMPKLTPFGLKSHTMPSDQSVLTSKSMPSLASVAMRLSSPKTTD